MEKTSSREKSGDFVRSGKDVEQSAIRQQMENSRLMYRAGYVGGKRYGPVR